MNKISASGGIGKVILLLILAAPSLTAFADANGNRFQWQAEGDVVLSCTSDDDGKSAAQLVCVDSRDADKKFVLAAEKGEHLVSMYGTAGAEGNLVTVWSVDKVYKIRVYRYTDGKLFSLFEAGSRLLPEIDQVVEAGNVYHRIIITYSEMVPDKHTGEVQLRANNSDVYTWKGDTYHIRRGVEWFQRHR